MKEKELRESAQCAVCHKAIGHTGLPLFWRVTIERFGVNLNAVRRQDGLAMMLGSQALASVMGANEEMTVSMMEPVKVSVCESCAMGDINIAVLAGME